MQGAPGATNQGLAPFPGKGECPHLPTVLHGAGEQEAEIRMNHPLRSEGYTFYQFSYIDGARQTTVLSVVRNAGLLFVLHGRLAG